METVVYILIVSLFVVAGTIYAVKFFKHRQTNDSGRKLDMALVGLSQLLRKNPNDPVALTKRGQIRFKKGDAKGAMADLDRAVQLDPGSVEAHYQRGILFQAMGDRSAAEKDFNWIMSHSEDPFFKTAVSNRLSTLRASPRR